MVRQKERDRPRDYIAKGHKWPDGALKPDAPIEAHLAKGIVTRANKYIADRFHKNQKTPNYKIAAKFNIAPQTLANILDGNTWPDLATIAKMERYLRRQLWGREHRDAPKPTT